MHLVRAQLGSNLPGEIAPRDSGQAFFTLDYVERVGVDLRRPPTVWIRLSTDQRFTRTLQVVAPEAPPVELEPAN